MAIMAKELMKYPLIRKYTGKYEDYLREDTDKKFWLVNTNKLVRFYPGVDGVKTGFTTEAKYCLTASAEKEWDACYFSCYGSTYIERTEQSSNEAS